MARIGMGQMLVEGGARDANLDRACEMIAQGAAMHCGIVVLPECLDLGWTYPGARQMAEPVPGPVSDRLASAARQCGVYVVAGITERAADKIYNAAVLLSPKGEILSLYRKINELAVARDLYATGQSVQVTETPEGAIGLTICSDNFPDSLVFGHALGRMGANLVLSPCAWAVEADHDQSRTPYGELWRKSYATLTRLYDMTVIGVSNVGWLRHPPWSGRMCIGCSMAIGPGGKVLALGPYGVDAEAMIVVEAPLAPPAGRGTDWGPCLRLRGYQGP